MRYYVGFLQIRSHIGHGLEERPRKERYVVFIPLHFALVLWKNNKMNEMG